MFKSSGVVPTIATVAGMKGRRLWRATAALALICLLATLAGLAGAGQAVAHRHRHRHRGAASLGTTPLQSAGSAHRPNIVLILTDDLSMNLLRFMPHVQAMERSGLTFGDYFVSDSLCCPSRASLLTGELPHGTGVFSNTGPHGGFDQFFARDEERRTFAVALERAGYRTALMGKYMNGYMSGKAAPSALPATYEPPGWTTWDGVGWGYGEFNYLLNRNGTLHGYGHQPSDYLTDVLARQGQQFIAGSAAMGRPFFLELSTFAPHRPYVPAPRNKNDYPGLQAPRDPSFDVLPADPPKWLAQHGPLSAAQQSRIDRVFRRRARSVEAIDQMIGQIQSELATDGQARNTYLVFTSDNGLHAGEYRLMPGKMTAFDTDIHVPLVIDGPGVPAGARTDAMAENIDLAKTFATIGGTSLPGDGHSLVPLLGGVTPADWRDAILVEHKGAGLHQNDPDFQESASGNPNTYEAMRTHQFLYVEYSDGEREFYDLRQDPFELRNLASSLTPRLLAQLHGDMLALEQCHGETSCWNAMHVGRIGTALSRRRGHGKPRR